MYNVFVYYDIPEDAREITVVFMYICRALYE